LRPDFVAQGAELQLPRWVQPRQTGREAPLLYQLGVARDIAPRVLAEDLLQLDAWHTRRGKQIPQNSTCVGFRG